MDIIRLPSHAYVSRLALMATVTLSALMCGAALLLAR